MRDLALENAIRALDASVALVQHEVALALATTAHMDRGRRLPLTADERRTRQLWLAGEVPLLALDNAIDKNIDRVLSINGYQTPHATATSIIRCAEGFYLLKDHNGGKDPRAIDPFDRWRKPGEAFVNRTADCAAMQWSQGADRYQPDLASYIYGGWMNTDSIIVDATTRQKVYRQVRKPARGGMIICASGSRGHRIGHMGGTPDGDEDFEYGNPASWDRLKVVDIAARNGRANRATTARGWFDTNAIFVVPAWT